MLDAGSIEAHEWPGNLSTTQERMLWSMYNTVMGAPFLLPPSLFHQPNADVPAAREVLFTSPMLAAAQELKFLVI